MARGLPAALQPLNDIVTCNPVPAMPTNETLTTRFLYDGRANVYAFGGRHGRIRNYGTPNIFKYILATGEWKFVTKMKSPRFQQAIVQITEDKVMIIGKEKKCKIIRKDYA